MEHFNNEIKWLTYSNDGIPVYIITSDILRTEYYLYKVTNGKAKKTARKAKIPTYLYKYLK